MLQAMNIKKEKSLKLQLFEEIHNNIKNRGFKLNVTKGMYTHQPTKGVTELFMLVCPHGATGWRVHPDVGIRFDVVEDIFHQVSGYEKKYQKGTPTIGTGVGNLLFGDNRKCEFLLASASDLSSVADNIEKVFCSVALPYYQEFGSIYAVDALLNSNPRESSRQRPVWERYATGLIVAKLTKRTNYDELVSIYKEILTTLNNGFYLKKLLLLIEILNSIVTP